MVGHENENMHHFSSQEFWTPGIMAKIIQHKGYPPGSQVIRPRGAGNFDGNVGVCRQAPRAALSAPATPASSLRRARPPTSSILRGARGPSKTSVGAASDQAPGHWRSRSSWGKKGDELGQKTPRSPACVLAVRGVWGRELFSQSLLHRLPACQRFH